MMFPLAFYRDHDDDEAASHWGNMDICTVIYTDLRYCHALLFLAYQSNVTGISAETRDSIARCVLKCFAFYMIEIPYNITWYYLIKKGDIWREIIAWNIISIPLTSLFDWSQHWGAWKACVYSLFPALPLIYHLRDVRVFPRPWPSTVAKDLPVKRQKSEMPEDIAMLSDL